MLFAILLMINFVSAWRMFGQKVGDGKINHSRTTARSQSSHQGSSQQTAAKSSDKHKVCKLPLKRGTCHALYVKWG